MRRDHRHVGLAEIAVVLGVSKARAHRISRDHQDFPPPIDALRMGNVWHLDDVQAWVEAHPDRTPGRHTGTTKG